MFATTSSNNIIPFPARGLPGQHDLFLGPLSTTMASTSPVGLAVEMVHRPCRACGCTNFIIGSSVAMHHASLRCVECNRHGGWLSRGAYTAAQMSVEKFGKPTVQVAVRKNKKDF
jgi:hypothetical protein